MLTVYRRHLRTCKAEHPEELRTSEFDERKRGWKRCDCPIFASGTLQKIAKRKNTGQWEWDAAKLVSAAWEKLGNWNGKSPEPVASPAPAASEERVTIKDATDAYIAACRNRGIAAPTLSKYKTFVKQLDAFCDKRGLVLVGQLTITDADRFYASWKDGKRARAKKLERFKAFTKFCLKREWMEKDISSELKAPQGSSIPANKSPFVDEELERIFAACDQIGGATKPGPGYRPWAGEDVKDFVYVSIYTGLRISDVSTFNIEKRLKGNDVFLRMHKTQKELYTWIPDWLVARMRAREKKRGPLIFKAGQATNMRAMSERWRENLGKVFRLAGSFEEKATPHRLRHTFVRILLEKGVPVADVAELIGDTEEMVRRHYSKWIKTRQDRLSRILQEAFADKPKPKVVNIC